MPRSFVISDIHGCCKTFKKLLLEVITINKKDKIYCVGDYVDRGHDSKGVIDFILQLRSEGYNIHTLRGNHEQMMLDAMNDETSFSHWLENGGNETLLSFGITSLNKLEKKYVAFLKRTKFYIETNKYIIVHAGLNFKTANPFNEKDAMLWTRDEYFDKAMIKNKILVHGHTPIRYVDLINQKNCNKINIDGGCVYDYKPGYGYLIALQLPEMKIIELKNIG